VVRLIQLLLVLRRAHARVNLVLEDKREVLSDALDLINVQLGMARIRGVDLKIAL
jgi:Lhr-like helicase